MNEAIGTEAVPVPVKLEVSEQFDAVWAVAWKVRALVLEPVGALAVVATVAV